MAMQVAWCAAKVTACSICATSTRPGTQLTSAVSAKRSTLAPAATSSQRCRLRRWNQRPWRQKNSTSTAAASAHSAPTAALPQPRLTR